MSKARNKRGSLNHQINARMKEMNCIGESRHQAKQEARENLGYKHNKTVGIHSYKSFDTYKSSCKQFVKWIKETDQSIKNIEDVKAEHIREYIKDRAESGKSAYTYSKDLAALNKVFGTEVTKKECGVANRSYKDITNNRQLKEHHNHINYKNYQREIDMVRATGMRRESLTRITPNAFNYKADGTPYQVRLKDERAEGGSNLAEKGARERIVDMPYQLQDRVREIVEEHRENGNLDNKPIFDHVPSRLGTHRFRQEFAETTYKNYLEEHGESTVYRGYDKEAIQHTTQQLGHNRMDIVIYNYLSARN